MFISNKYINMGRKKETVVVKDYGNITVPTSWEQITLGLQEEENKTDVSLIDIMAVLTGTDKKYIYSLPSDFANTIMAHLLFLNEPLKEEPKPEVIINGNLYKINYMEKLKFGEYTDANTVMANDKFDYASLLAILCRKEGEAYDDDFIANHIEERTQMWNNQPITKVYPLVCFFLTLSALSGQHLQHYMTDAEQAINQSLTHIEGSLKDGAVKKFSLSYVKALWKLRKLRKCMSQLSSTTSHT